MLNLMSDLKETGLVTIENAEYVYNLSNEIIDESKLQYGFIGKKWKPLVVTDYWVYQKRTEAKEFLKIKI